nr:MAG TPA: hypothetical protein [Caudoviricetes sp.]
MPSGMFRTRAASDSFGVEWVVFDAICHFLRVVEYRVWFLLPVHLE